MDIALITEGTYPYHEGGVSTWCDQLVRGLAPHRFGIYPITATGYEKMSWELPENVTGVWPVALWGPTPSPSRSLVGSQVLHRAFERLATSMVEADGESNFLLALREIHELSGDGPLAGALRSPRCLEILLDVMRVASVPDRLEDTEFQDPSLHYPTLADAIAALDLIEHQLRPLFEPPPAGDLCHATANGLATLTALTAHWAHNTPFVMSEHGIYLRERYLAYTPVTYRHPVRTILLRFFKRVTWSGYQIADVIAPGSEYNRQWEEINGARSDRIRPVYNGVDATHFPVAPAEPEIPTLTWVGRIAPLKDVETLLRAFAHVRVKLPEVRLRIFGGTPKGNEPYRTRCQQLLVDLGLSGAATFEGRVESVVDAYHAGHVVLLTSISEGFPYTLIEAMAAGRPTIATDVGGVKEASGDAGIVVPPRDPLAMANACLELLGDPDGREALGRAARERILSLFTVEQSMALFSDIYREVTGRPTSADIVEHDQHLQGPLPHDEAPAELKAPPASAIAGSTRPRSRRFRPRRTVTL